MREPGIIARFRRFTAEQRGAAAVEFALVLPLLLLLFLGSIETSSLLTTDRRITIISGTVGDLVARTDGTLGERHERLFQASPISSSPASAPFNGGEPRSRRRHRCSSVMWSCGGSGVSVRQLAPTPCRKS